MVLILSFILQEIFPLNVLLRNKKPKQEGASSLFKNLICYKKIQCVKKLKKKKSKESIIFLINSLCKDYIKYFSFFFSFFFIRTNTKEKDVSQFFLSRIYWNNPQKDIFYKISHHYKIFF